MSYTDKTKEAVIHLYTMACVDLHKRFQVGNDYAKEMAMCDALEANYPDIIMALHEADKLKLTNR